MRGTATPAMLRERSTAEIREDLLDAPEDLPAEPRTPLPGILPGRTFREKVRRSLPWLAAAVACAIVCTLLSFHFHRVMFSSTTVFLLNDDAPEDVLERLAKGPRTEITRLQYMAGSMDVLDHLMDRFPLLERAGIDPSDSAARARFYPILSQRITTQLLEMRLVEVQVKDADPVMAAQMANEIYAYLDHAMAAERRALLERDLRVYRNMLDTVTQEADMRTRSLLTAAKEVEGSLGLAGGGSRANAGEFFDARAQLGSIVTQLAQADRDLVELKQRTEMLLARSLQEERPELRLISKALVDEGTRPWLVIGGTALLWAVFISGIFLSAMLIWHLHGAEFIRYLGALDKGRLS